jgi:TatD DNase family protein
MRCLRFIDTHAHLHFVMERMKVSFEGLSELMLKQSNEQFELEAVVNVYCETEELMPDHSSHLLLEHELIYGAFGQHPHNASKWSPEVEGVVLWERF